MRLLAFVAIAALLGGVAAAILFALGWSGMGGAAFALGAIALTCGFTVASGPISTLGMPVHESWPRLWPQRQGGAR